MFKYLFLAFMVVLLDQFTKFFVIFNLDLKEIVSVLPFLNITLINNYGAAFGILSDPEGIQRWIFLGIALIVSMLILFWLKNSIYKKNKLECFCLVLILGGAIGNFIDRLLYGYVVDFIDFYIKNWHWYTFNIADVAICIGSSFLLIELFFLKNKQKKY